MKSNILSGILAVLLLFLFCFPGEALEASRQGLHLWLNTLLPTLLPFMILSNLMITFGSLDRILAPLKKPFHFLLGLSPYGAYAFLLGMLCGYPMGAKLTSDLYKSGRISRGEAQYLLAFSNQVSPMFLTTYVVLECLNRKELLGISFGILYVATLLCALLFRLLLHERNQNAQSLSYTKKENPRQLSAGACIDLSIMNGFETITRLGGYILLFSLSAAAISKLWPSSIPGKILLLGFTEISTGLYYLANAGLPFTILYPMVMTCTAFGGLSILAQTKSVVTASGLSMKTCLAGKSVHALLTLLLSLLFIQFVQ